MCPALFSGLIIMLINSKVFYCIKNHLCNYDCESGGIIGGKDGVVTEFFFDGIGDSNEYVPNIKKLNSVIQSWDDQSIDFLGVVHSHRCKPELSFADVEYARSIVTNNGISEIIMLVYVLELKNIYAYKVTKTNIYSLSIDCI